MLPNPVHEIHIDGRSLADRPKALEKDENGHAAQNQRGHIRNPPARKSSPSPIVFGACSAATATASVACNRIIISSIKSFLVFRSFPSRARQRPHTHTAAAESQKYAFSSKSHRGPAICGHFYFPSAATFRLSAAALRSACRSSRDRRRRCRRSLMFRIRSPKLSKLCR